MNNELETGSLSSWSVGPQKVWTPRSESVTLKLVRLVDYMCGKWLDLLSQVTLQLLSSQANIFLSTHHPVGEWRFIFWRI